jgi:hypothetical protein
MGGMEVIKISRARVVFFECIGMKETLKKGQPSARSSLCRLWRLPLFLSLAVLAPAVGCANHDIAPGCGSPGKGQTTLSLMYAAFPCISA